MLHGKLCKKTVKFFVSYADIKDIVWTNQGHDHGPNQHNAESKKSASFIWHFTFSSFRHAFSRNDVLAQNGFQEKSVNHFLPFMNDAKKS